MLPQTCLNKCVFVWKCPDMSEYFDCQHDILSSELYVHTYKLYQNYLPFLCYCFLSFKWWKETNTRMAEFNIHKVDNLMNNACYLASRSASCLTPAFKSSDVSLNMDLARFLNLTKKETLHLCSKYACAEILQSTNQYLV